MIDPSLVPRAVLSGFAVFSLLVESVTSARGHGLTSNVTNILNQLMHERNYDRRIRPGLGGDPVPITVNIFIRSLGPVSEKDEEFSLDCYFRQMWQDDRLQFNSTEVSILSMNWLFLEKIWKPDTYFVNGKKSYLHKITVPNKFIRIESSGRLTYSMRLTIKGSCPMHLKKFPLDSQLCPLEIGSYGYSNRDVTYRWESSKPVVLNSGVGLAQYDINNITTFQGYKINRRKENVSLLLVHFHLKRLTGYFLLQVYIPCVLIVSCSWVSFWITKRDVPGRVSLGVTTVLTMTTLGFGSRSNWPRVSYATALDWWVIMCFAFVFASMVEFATINFVEKRLYDKKARLEEMRRYYVSKRKRLRQVIGAQMSTDDPGVGGCDCFQGGGAASAVCCSCGSQQAPSGGGRRVDCDQLQLPVDLEQETTFTEFTTLRAPLPDSKRAGAGLWSSVVFGRNSQKWSYDFVLNKLARINDREPHQHYSVVDLYSRVVFPLLFAALNAVYWILYLYCITDDLESDVVNLTLVSL